MLFGVVRSMSCPGSRHLRWRGVALNKGLEILCWSFAAKSVVRPKMVESMADCDDYEAIAAWGKAHLPFLRRYLPYYHGVPGGRWLTMLSFRFCSAMSTCRRPRATPACPRI